MNQYWQNFLIAGQINNAQSQKRYQVNYSHQPGCSVLFFGYIDLAFQLLAQALPKEKKQTIITSYSSDMYHNVVPCLC